MQNSTNLVWSPTHIYIQEQLLCGEELRMIVAPFIQSKALLSLVEYCNAPDALCVITRWTGHDIVSGISDLDVYPLLRDRGIPLYLNQSIHLKLLIFASNWTFVTSGNITNKGMGLVDPHNLEVGCRAELGTEDWQAVYHLLGASFRVDDKIYSDAVAYREAHNRPTEDLTPLTLAPKENQEFSTLSLPATESPSQLYANYAHTADIPENELAAFMHDVALYQIPPGLDEAPFNAWLQESFTSQPFTHAIVALIKEAGSARFGLVNEWLQTNCSDNPTPYRWELKSATKRLYNWLDSFYEEISWDRPQHSMVIRWTVTQP